MLMAKRWGRLGAASVALAVALAGCGGGSGAEGDPANPVVTGPTAQAPVLSVQPGDAQAVVGGQARFSADSATTNVSWAWQISTDGGTTWVAIANASTNSLTLTGLTLADNNKRYRAVASRAGLQTLSSAALLVVSAGVVAPSITVALAPQQAVAGGSASFAVTATGTDLQYQWQSSRDGLNCAGGQSMAPLQCRFRLQPAG